METKYKINDRLVINGLTCVISKIGPFGCTNHYGFMFADSNGNYHGGWMPVALVDTNKEVHLVEEKPI